MAFVEWTKPVAVDNSGMVTLTNDSNDSSMYPIGSTVIKYNASDSSGNLETCQFTVFVSDFEDPQVTCPPNIEAFADNGTNVRLNWTMPTATDNSGVVTLNFTHQLNSEFPVGTTYITATASDLSGNSASCTFTATIYPTDVEMPMIICPPHVSGLTDQWMNSTNLTWIVPQYRDNQEIVVFNVSHQNGSRFTIGTTVVTYFIADRAGNNASCSFNVTVVDAEKPVFLDCPSDVFIMNNESRVVNFTQPEVTDNSGGPVNVTSNYPSGTQFPFSDTIVIFTAEDKSGNRATCNFTVSVDDFEAPVLLNCSSNINLYLYNDSANATANWTEPVFSDNAGVFMVDQEFFPGDQFPVGVNEIVISATDEAGNMVACVFNVTVIDLSPPVIVSCPGNMSTNTDPNKPTANVSWPLVQVLDNVEVASVIVTQEPGTAFPVGTTLVTYTATDSSGNTDQNDCRFYIHVSDNEAPMFVNCPSHMMFSTDVGVGEATVSWTVPMATDNVNVTFFEASHRPGDNFSLGPTEVTYRIADSAGNNNTCSFIITINDEEGPVFQNCPDNVTAATDPRSDMAIATWNTLVAIDNSGAVITPTSNSRSGDSFAIGSTTVLYIALDPNNNIGRCEFEVIVIDNELPEFTNCPSDLEVMLMGGENSTLANWTEPIAKDNSGSVNVSLLSQLPSEFLIGRTLVIYTATDPSANTASCSFNVIVFSSDMLMIACPADVILFTDPSVNSSTASWPAPVFNSSIVVAVNSSHANNSRFEVGHAVVTYTIAGKDGRNASCDFFVTVIDNESPVFSRCSSNFVSSASPSMATGTAFWVAPTASDNVGVTKLTSNYEPMAVLPIGITVVTYIAIDAAGNRANCSFNATILDNEDPVFTFCPVTLEFMADAFGNVIVPTSGMPIATDNDGPLSVSTNYNLAMLDVGSTTLVAFTAMDDAENMATCNVNITVIANSGDSPPVFISCPSNIVVSTVMTQSYTLVTWAVPQAQDDRSTPIVIEQSGYMPGRQFAIGMWMVIYVATDSIGQTAFCEFNITVLDQEDPVIIGCPANINEVTMNNAPIVVSWTPPTASDNSGEFTLQANDNHAPGEMLNVGMYDVIYTAIDPSGNVANCEFEVIIENDAPPEFISCPSSTVVPTDPGQPYATVSFSYPNPTDDRSSPMLFGSHGPGTQFPIGDTTVTFTAYDSASQSAQCVFVITVEDRGDPVIIDCPSDQTVYVLSTSDVAAVFWTPPTANDTNNFTLTSNRNPGDEFETGSTQVTYTATDVSGNTDTCSFSVVVQETLPTYDTTGSVNLVRIGSIASPFAASDVQTRLPALRDDMDRLFRTSSVSGDFVGITVTGSSVETSDKALIEFVIYFAGSPAPNDTQIADAFYAALGPLENQFDTSNQIDPGTFMLSLTTCQQTSCQNGGSCVPQENSFVCMCTLFWTGDYCETDINECVENNPCAADRICINLQGSYLCGCQAGFFLVGDTCRATSEFRGSFAITRIGSSEAIFTRDLEDPTSDQYQRIAGDVIGVLDSIFADESSYIESRVVSMSSGSIRVQYVLVFTEDTNVTVDVVSNQMRASIAADGEIASSALYIRLSSLSVASNLCPADYCKNGGTCSPDPVTYENNCICESAFSGNRCEVEDDWSPLVIAMVTVAGILFLILVGLFISCCIFLGKRLEEKEPKYAGDLEGRDSFLKVSQPVLPWRSSSPSTDEPPHHPRGSNVSTSFAVQSIRVDGGAGCYRHSGDVRNGQQSSTFIRPYIVTGKEAAEH